MFRLILIILLFLTRNIHAATLLIFSLGQPLVPCNQAVLDNPKVGGISLRIHWKDLEPTRGNYDYSFFDSEIARAKAAGKQVMIRVMIEQGNAPDWVYDGAQTFYAPSGGYVWVYWDPFALAAAQEMYAALGDHYMHEYAITITSVSCCTDTSGDWSVPHTRADITQWNLPSYGYDSTKAIQACESLIDVCRSHFSGNVVTMACGRNGQLDPTENYCCQALANYGYNHWPWRFAIQKNGFSAVTPDSGNNSGTSFEILSMVPGIIVGAQALWWTYGDSTYRNNDGTPGDPQTIFNAMLGKVQEYGARWFEVYEDDCLNLQLP